MRYKIALIRGDGIGPEQADATTPLIGKLSQLLGLGIEIVEVEAGDECLKRRGTPLPDETIEALKGCLLYTSPSPRDRG